MSDFGSELEKVQDEKTEHATQQRIFDLQQSVSRARSERDSMAKLLADAERDTEELAVELSLYRRPWSDQPQWLRTTDDSSHHGTLVAFLSDTHYGEVVRPEEIGGYNAYDLRIAELRTHRFFERTVRLAENYLAGVSYDGIVLALGGDLVSGSIHDELVETNELSVYRTVEACLPWLREGIEMFMEAFGRVHVVSAPGNHGRNSVKPRHKKRSENNADTHIARLLANIVRSDDVTFDIPESADVDFRIYDYVFSLEHGDNLKFNGTSEIGSLGPVKRGNLRKTKKRQEQQRPFKYGLYGHFHQFVPAYTQGFVMNGSLKGYDEYASDGQFAPEPPQQALLVVVPEHGITATMPVLVSSRDAEGW